MNLRKLGQVESKENLSWAKEKASQILNSVPSQDLIFEAFLFGSASQGRFSAHSDFDFLIVTQDESSIKQLQKEVYSARFADVAIDWIFKTKEEFQERKSFGGVCFIAFNEGIKIR